MKSKMVLFVVVFNVVPFTSLDRRLEPIGSLMLFEPIGSLNLHKPVGSIDLFRPIRSPILHSQ